MTALKKAIVQAYSSADHKAEVQIIGSLPVWLSGVPVATNIAAAEVVPGRACSVLFLDDSNPEDAVVISVQGALPSGGSPRIQDADGDTSVDAEASPDEDKIRITVAGIERGLLQTASPHVKLTGEIQLGDLDTAVGIGTAPLSGRTLRVNMPSDGSSPVAMEIAGGPSISADYGQVTGLQGTPIVSLSTGTVGHRIKALNFSVLAGLGGAGTVVSELIGVYARPYTASYGGTITLGAALYADTPARFGIGSPSYTENVGVEVKNPGAAYVVDAYGVRIADISGNSGVKRALEILSAYAGVPYLRVVSGAAPGAGATNLYLAEGAATPVLRRVQWKDGASIGAGDRVMVLV